MKTITVPEEEAVPMKQTPNPGVGMPVGLYLEQFGQIVWDAFGTPAYHVGSSLMGKDWRDVDVRLILSDETWDTMKLGDPRTTHSNLKWRAYTLAFAALAAKMTGLPVDFQIQKQSHANEHHKGNRSALFVPAEYDPCEWVEREPGKWAPSRLGCADLTPVQVGNDGSLQTIDYWRCPSCGRQINQKREVTNETR